MFLLEGGGGGIHLGVGLLHVVDLVVLTLLVPSYLTVAVLTKLLHAAIGLCFRIRIVMWIRISIPHEDRYPDPEV